MNTNAPAFRINRRAALAGLAATWAASGAFAADKPKIVTMLGDSITAGYGLAAADALPAQLQAELVRLGVNVVVRASGVSGDTTADALGRVGFSVQSDTDLCLIELGGNDLLQGIDPNQTRANLTAIIDKLKARHIRAMLTGIRAPTAIGSSYANDFNNVVPDVAKAEHVPVYLLPIEGAGAGRDRSLLQRDGIHPNPAGVKIIAAKMAPAIARALANER